MSRTTRTEHTPLATASSEHVVGTPGFGPVSRGARENAARRGSPPGRPPHDATSLSDRERGTIRARCPAPILAKSIAPACSAHKTTRALYRLFLSIAIVALAGEPAAAQRNNLPPELVGVGVEQRLGESVPLDATFTDSSGKEVRLGDLLGERPAIVAPVYYDCPMICDMVLEGVTRAARTLELEVGRDFDVIAASFDPDEKPELAEASKATVVERYGRPGTEAGWHFLTADPEAIQSLTEAIGFRYKKIEATGEFAHSAAIAIITPEGRISQYLYGIDYAPRNVRLGLVEASNNRIGSLVDQIVLFCYRYDPSTGKYTLAVWFLIRTTALLMVAAIGAFVLINLARERRRRVTVGASP